MPGKLTISSIFLSKHQSTKIGRRWKGSCQRSKQSSPHYKLMVTCNRGLIEDEIQCLELQAEAFLTTHKMSRCMWKTRLKNNEWSFNWGKMIEMITHKTKWKIEWAVTNTAFLLIFIGKSWISTSRWYCVTPAKSLDGNVVFDHNGIAICQSAHEHC